LVDNRSDSTKMHDATVRYIMSIILLDFVIYPDLNQVTNNIRIVSKKEISLKFRLIYFMA